MNIREEYLNVIKNKEQKELFNKLYEKSQELDLKISRSKTKDIIYVFVDPNTKRRVMKFTFDKEMNPMVHLRFNMAGNYSNFFDEAIRLTIEEFSYKYTGCYGCGSCDGTDGYTYVYEDGRTYYRCPNELIELFNLSMNQYDEVVHLLENQVG